MFNGAVQMSPQGALGSITPPQSPQTLVDAVKAQFAAVSNQRHALKVSIKAERDRRAELERLIEEKRKIVQSYTQQYASWEVRQT